MSQGTITNKARQYKFYLGSRERYIRITSDFDSGNIQLVKQISEFQYRLASTLDGAHTGSAVNSKSWFYFKATGFTKGVRGKFIVTRTQALLSILHSKWPNSYRPVYRSNGEEWLHLPTQCHIYQRQSGEVECVFQYLFKSELEEVEFAFTYPYLYSQHVNFINSLQVKSLSQIYFKKEILTQSCQGRPIHLLTITANDGISPNQSCEDIFDPLLFPQKQRPLKFSKPTILISARVHPGETSASYALQGVVNFLLNTQDLRAEMLRKMFVFMVIPMINPDGVYHGHFRMDALGQNLNRHYLHPDFTKQPSVYAIKQLAVHLNKENRLSFYFDLHAHNAKKGAFIYGNAINDFVQQVESQVFCKLFALNNEGFEYKSCNFSEKHMKAKDHNEDLTKEGCGRVVMYRLTKMIHSYSLECGIISANHTEEALCVSNSTFEAAGLHCTDQQIKKKTKGHHKLFDLESYRGIGRSMLVSVLDVFDKNPYSKVYTSSYSTLDSLRRATAFEIFHKAERFRMFEKFIFGKVRNINELIKEVLRTKLLYKNLYDFDFNTLSCFRGVIWPAEIVGLKQSPNSHKRKATSLMKGKLDYSESFFKALSDHKKVLEEQVQPRKTSRKNTEHDSIPIETVNSDNDSIGEQNEKTLSQSRNVLSFSRIKMSMNNPEGESPYVETKYSYQMNYSTESSSVRVRKLLKHDSVSKHKAESGLQATEVDSEAQNQRIYNKLCAEIKQQLTKGAKSLRPPPKLKFSHLSQMGYFLQKGERITPSTAVRKSPSRGILLCQLPSISSHPLATSTRTINKKY